MARVKNRYRRTQGRRTTRDPVVRGADGVDRIAFDSVGEAVTDSLADYAQNEGNCRYIADRMAYHATGSDAWANCYTRERLLEAISNPPRELLEAVDEMRRQLVEEVSPPVCTRRRVLQQRSKIGRRTPRRKTAPTGFPRRR